jgi:hypothetical protein
MDENCSCKDQLILGKDHHELLLEYTDSEEKSLHALDVQMSLGIGLQTFDFETLLYECQPLVIHHLKTHMCQLYFQGLSLHRHLLRLQFL